jgi:hypothetical protein
VQNERRFEILDDGAIVQNVTIMAECETVNEKEEEEEEEEEEVEATANESQI